MDFLRLHQTSSKCNLNIQNIILNWYGKIVKSKKYEKFQNAGGGARRRGRCQLCHVVGVENPSCNISFLVCFTIGIFVSRDPPPICESKCLTLAGGGHHNPTSLPLRGYNQNLSSLGFAVSEELGNKETKISLTS